MSKLSIIVPIYKVEPYLRRCVDSILAQTFTDFELILIDDGSPDGCPAICDEYAQKDSRIVVIHQENQGVSAARNAGLDIAQGEFIGFIDPDDWCDPQMYEKLLKAIEENGRDIAICGFNNVSENGTVYSQGLTEDGLFSQEAFIQALFGMPIQVGGCVTNKLFRRSVIKNVRFRSELTHGEDWVYLFDCGLVCEKGAEKIADGLYYVYERPGSATRAGSTAFYYRVLTSSLLLLLLLQNRPQYIGLGIDKYLDDCEQYLPLMCKAGKQSKEPYRMKKVRIKLTMLKWIIYAFLHKSLPAKKILAHLMLTFRI